MIHRLTFSADVIILILLSLLITAAVAYLPNHLVVISNRLWYYVHGEFLLSNGKAPVAQTGVGELMETAGKVVAETVKEL